MTSHPGVGGDPSTIAICVPARDEADRLPRLFEAIDALVAPPGISISLCLLLDGCTDESAAVASTHARRAAYPVHVAAVARADANAGVARHRAMRLGMSALAAGGGVLLTTDADSWPDRDWLVATMGALRHADLVVGDVVRAGPRADAAQNRIELYYARLFTLRRRTDPVPWEAARTHHHASGANMAMRAALYTRLGGFPPLRQGEDARLVDDASRAGFRVRRDAASIVHTSGRRDGRAQGGLASALRALDRDGLDAVRVAHPADQAWQYRAHALARRAFDSATLADLSTAIGLTTDHLTGVARDAPNAEAFAMRVVPAPPGGMRHVPLTVAETALATLEAAVVPAKAA
ncbi:glycosyltransferase [Sphingomonas abaci]|uniref:Glycosyltransferase 2-like domain-containing protein n=1 Tax=Sphingomonas abaci TaxID=237611 RepID=A0A7W7AMF3_9SPHN|nr:glycosyltransferase family 2 protein [Sphingomonas abaci]MBB4618825.1 hypothetical protein [Sphingomonas abaci]